LILGLLGYILTVFRTVVDCLHLPLAWRSAGAVLPQDFMFTNSPKLLVFSPTTN
jgi:hypothetical protein